MAISATPKNHLLKALSAKDLQSHFHDLQLVKVPLRKILCESGDKIEHVYFPEDSLISVITILSDGAMVEVGMIGAEGLTGLPALVGTGISANQIIVQAAGYAYRTTTATCKAAFNQSETFRKVALRHFENFMNLAGQTAACNRLHSIEQRAARWLLMATDRLQKDNMQMTHEFLSAMLGTRRAGVTETAGELQRQGLIRYHHGKLTISNRAGLESMACECYESDRTRLKALKKLGRN